MSNPQPNPDVVYIRAEDIERLGPQSGSPPPGPDADAPPLPPLLNLPDLIARYGPMARGVLHKIRQAHAQAARRAPASPSPAPPRPPQPVPGQTTPDVTFAGVSVPAPPAPATGTRTAVSYLLAGLAGAVATGLAVAAFSAVQQHGYNKAEAELGLSRSQKRRRRRNRSRRRTPRAQKA